MLTSHRPTHCSNSNIARVTPQIIAHPQFTLQRASQLAYRLKLSIPSQVFATKTWHLTRVNATAVRFYEFTSCLLYVMRREAEENDVIVSFASVLTLRLLRHRYCWREAMERAIKKIEFHIKHETLADHDRTQVNKTRRWLWRSEFSRSI